MFAIHTMPGHLIRRLNQISASLFQELMAELGEDLTPVQYAALSILQQEDGIDQATLAALIAYDRATIGGVIDRLEAKRFVTRRVSPDDRRARIVSLSEAGAALLEKLDGPVADMQDRILAGLTEDERDTFVRLAAKATAAGNASSRAPLDLDRLQTLRARQ